MKILGTKELDEKLNIQPVNKGRLKNATAISNSRGWKKKLVTGDIVVIRIRKRSSANAEIRNYRYVSKDDILKYDYTTNGIKLGQWEDSRFSDGVFYRYIRTSTTFKGKLPRFAYNFVNDYSDDIMGVSANHPFSECRIIEIYRPNNVEQPFTDDYCKMEIDPKNEPCRCIYRLSGQVSEKLNIQPVSKSRLSNIKRQNYVKIGNRYWTVRNAATTVTADGYELVDGVDYNVVDGEYYYTQRAATKIAPKGWRVPSVKDTDDLYAAMEDNNFLPLIATEYGGTNESGFNAKLVGIYYKGHILGEGRYADFMVYKTYTTFIGGIANAKVPKPHKMHLLAPISHGGNNEHGSMWDENAEKEEMMTVRFCRDL